MEEIEEEEEEEWGGEKKVKKEKEYKNVLEWKNGWIWCWAKKGKINGILREMNSGTECLAQKWDPAGRRWEKMRNECSMTSI